MLRHHGDDLMVRVCDREKVEALLNNSEKTVDLEPCSG